MGGAHGSSTARGRAAGGRPDKPTSDVPKWAERAEARAIHGGRERVGNGPRVRERIRTKGVVDGHLADLEIVAGRSHVDAEQFLHGRLESPNETLCPAAGGMGETTPVPSAYARVLRQPTTASGKGGVRSDRRPLC